MISLFIVIAVVLGLLLYLFFDYRGPGKIRLKDGGTFKLKHKRAGELIVQECDSEGNLWASRALIIYRLRPGEDKFVRVAHVPTGFSYLWLNNFSLFRKFTNKPECLEFTISSNGSICALSAGYMLHSSPQRIRFRRTMELRHYGFGVGRGILSNGLLSASGNQIYWGEYFRNPERGEVHVYRSADGGESWEQVYSYQAGDIRHVHGIQEDPFTGKLWISAGDSDSESKIAWTEDNFKSLTQIGTGSQAWRTTQLVFTEDAVYWGADTGSVEHGGIYRWDRSTRKTSQVCSSPGGILFGTRLLNGTLVFTVDREGFENETDKWTRLFVLRNDGSVSEIRFGTWKHRKKGIKYSFAMLRVPRKQGSNRLALSVINQEEFPAGELLLIDEGDLDSTVTGSE
jgi:hypothetical protein